jgi:glycosyltransferase involved in cell wall biosynthesis
LNPRDRLAVSVVVPAYREEEYIKATLKGIAEALRGASLKFEIIVVLDLVEGDETASHVRNISCRYREIRVIGRRGRRGVGDAVITGIRRSHGKIIIIAMGDRSEHPSDIVRLARAGADCDLVFTNRFKHGRPEGYPVLKYIANRCCNFAAMALFRMPYSDTTNAFKAYRKELLDQLSFSSRGFEIFLEMPIKAMTIARRIEELDVGHIVRTKQTPKLSITRDAHKYLHVLLSLTRSRKSS